MATWKLAPSDRLAWGVRLQLGARGRVGFVPCKAVSQSGNGTHAFSSNGAAPEPIKVAFIGAGGVNFGAPGRPWNHASRIQTFPGVEITAVVDPSTKNTEKKIAALVGSDSEYARKWDNCKIFDSHQDLLQDEERKPDAVFIGIPPECHGAVHDENARLELDLAAAGVHMFVEKPLSAKAPDEVQELSDQLLAYQKDQGLVVAVGYMLRHSPAVEAAKRLLEENDTPIACVVGRYASAYNSTVKRAFWDFTVSGGTIVEQATHFVDLMRYLGGEIDRESITAMAVGPDFPLSQMPPAPDAEHLVPFEHRVNRVTSSTWAFDSGAIGSLTHTCLLHESNYYTTLEVIADGMQLLISDPYNKPSLLVRRPLSGKYEEVPLDVEKDMYTHELEDFIQAVRARDPEKVKCPYRDGARTYQATKWITEVANNNRVKHGSWQTAGAQTNGKAAPAAQSKPERELAVA